MFCFIKLKLIPFLFGRQVNDLISDFFLQEIGSIKHLLFII